MTQSGYIHLYASSPFPTLSEADLNLEFGAAIKKGDDGTFFLTIGGDGNVEEPGMRAFVVVHVTV